MKTPGINRFTTLLLAVVILMLMDSCRPRITWHSTTKRGKHIRHERYSPYDVKWYKKKYYAGDL